MVGTVPGVFKLELWAETASDRVEAGGHIADISPELSRTAEPPGDGSLLNIKQKLVEAANLDPDTAYEQDPIVLAPQFAKLALRSQGLKGLAFAPIATAKYNGLLIYTAALRPLTDVAAGKVSITSAASAGVLPNSLSFGKWLLKIGNAGFANALLAGLIPPPVSYGDWSAGNGNGEFSIAGQTSPTRPMFSSWTYFGFPYPGAGSPTCSG